uniref:SH2 domain-containing protein n=1 Tax=Malurus cyaneus samueli TaxID=2593467 RepID=A0A8C5UIW4_9PASS
RSPAAVLPGKAQRCRQRAPPRGAAAPPPPPHLAGFSRRALRDDTSDCSAPTAPRRSATSRTPTAGPLVPAQAARHVPPGLLGARGPGRGGPEGFLLLLFCRAGTPPTTVSPHLLRSHSERRPATPPDVKYISPKHRLIKVESGAGGIEGAGKKLSKGSKQPTIAAPSAMKDKVLIADDYSDPFDAKSELNRMGKGENTGYMEPYEAQRIMAEFQQQEGMKSHQKNMQLYDTPYEPEGSGVESDSESVVSHRLRESKLPQDDDRPADEYDQPWEWNKVTIPALAAQFNGSGKRQASTSPSNDQHRQLRAPGGGFKPIKHGSPEFCGILGERIDPTIQLEKQIWYHGAISRTDAENLLRLCKECSYLVRNSQTSKHDYSLSLKSSQGFMHMKLMKTKEKYILGQNSPPFDSVPEVIHYYTTKKLPIKGAEHLSLLYPVAVRTL